MDPNPVAQKREARRIEEQAAEAIRAALPAEYVAEIEGRDVDARKRRKVDGSFGLQGYEAPDDVWYASEKRRLEAGKNGGQESLDGEGMLEAPEETKLIEDAGSNNTTGAQDGDGGGLLSGSTLAALKGFRAAANAPREAVKGPLVGYGSDDESD